MGFKGFRAIDFGTSITGSRWQSSLGKELEDALSQELNAPFKYTKAGRYNLIYLRHVWYIPYQSAAFQVYPGLEFFAGLKIERGLIKGLEDSDDNPELIYHSGWDFHRFEYGLKNKNKHMLDAVNYALERGLSFEICIGGECNKYSLDDAVRRIEDLDPSRWCDVYVGKILKPTDAIKMGGHISNFCVDTFLTVSRLYWQCVES